jgi:serine/threonine protein phosphatase 1
VIKSLFDRFKKSRLQSIQLFQSIDTARITDGRCVYAIGDIHGMSELWNKVLANIRSDIAEHDLQTDVIILGDFIDRGPDSRAVLDSILQSRLHANSNIQFTMLKGNHEQMLLNFLAAPEEHGSFWLRNGGLETLQSYGVRPPEKISGKQWNFLRDEFVNCMPETHMAALEQLPSKFIVDDYFFCHASIKQGQQLGKQTDQDLLWSRNFPNDSWGPQEKIIVHGHQPVTEPLTENFHINVDTGAYATGRLTCVKLCGVERKFISATG